ncbi:MULTISPECIES: TetR/AcrR family transcriptional regulator [unclassified Virgibacillus]|uniref:TetR/AcrR family transcriptional regulator n=1 Tax=unclassified Virgibacillus TaxID=2620237 RepID=UPI000AC89B45|nr:MULTISPECIES: TetR/AcrR family transcriptional regulator [unclassified Virgibacillus]MBS7428046.1 TetR/AcrR family transcriptional regulator [Virgibacillus sp. 19R1-5]
MKYNNVLDSMIAQAKKTKKQTEKQQKIVETAIRLFAEKGYANTSTSEIAKQAGVAEGLIFKHYGTKENLLRSVILPFFKSSLPDMAEEVFAEVLPAKTTSFEEFLRTLLHNRIQFFYENKQILQVVIKEIIYNESLKKELLPYLADTIRFRFKNTIEMFKARGELKDIPTDDIVYLLLPVLGGFIISRFVIVDVDAIHESEVEKLIEFIMGGIRKNEH